VAIHFDGSYWALDHDLAIESPPARGGLTPTVFVIGYIAVSIVLILLFRRRGMVLILLSIGFLLFFADLARRDEAIQSRYTATQCTVLDSMARFTASQSATTRRGSSGTWTPLFALRYATPTGEMVSVGYASPSRLRIGSPKSTEAALASLPRGATAPCWYDPDDPRQVLLVRDFGGAYAFALIPLAALILGIRLLRRRAGCQPAA
jgi:hypothetical protein